MSLYDDMDAIKQKSEQVAGWSSGIKLLQSQLQLKKAVQTQPRREALRKSGVTLAPVIDLKSKKDEEDSNSNSSFGSYNSGKDARGIPRDTEWNFEGEYDPMWPNDYEKVVKDLRELREREKEKEEEEKRRKNREDRDRRVRDRFDSNEDRRKSGFAGRKESDEEEEEEKPTSRVGGVAIAPPPSLQESVPSSESPRTPVTPVSGDKYGLAFGGSVAAKIMAKYGFKEGQGLGKQEQGISMALQVEKTSKRGGRIISEKEIMPPPSIAPLGSNSPGGSTQQQSAQSKPEPSITEIMRSPSKVVLLRNMVGPGEVDEDLEPEVKDECNTKYGEVVKVVIFEQPNVPSDEAVRIFVEFRRIESAIKAVVDLNGRFFGGRQELNYRWETVIPSMNTALSPVSLSIFYEALCPDSRSFFTKQLLPTFEKIPQLLQVNLIPYGKAKTESVESGFSFSCQHGPLECQANKIHACAVSKIPQQDLQLKYTTCMISDNMNPMKIGEQCAQEHGIKWKLIEDCATSSEGDELLKQHGDKTNELHPRISFVPTILLEKSQDNQPALLKNLFKEVCNHLQEQKMQLVPECG